MAGPDDTDLLDREPSPPDDGDGSGDPRDDQEICEQTDLLRSVIDATAREAADEAAALVGDLHIADLADLLELLPGETRRNLIGLIADSIDPTVLVELDGPVLTDVADALPPRMVAAAIQALDSDDAIHVMENLPDDTQRAVLRALARKDRIAVEEGLAYPEESAGRLMQRKLIAVPEFWSIGQTIDQLRAMDEDDLPQDFYELIVVDPTYRPVGTVPLSRVLNCKRPVRIRDVMEENPRLVHVATDQEEVARQFAKYHLISVGVVNDYGRLVGVITADDVVDVIEEEAQEDILALAGVSQGDVNIPLIEVTRSRFIWLFVNLGTAILASLVIGLFEATLQQMVALAVLMPIVASMGGNAGTQTMTVAVRALATRELSAANAMRIIGKELTVSLINGVLLAIVVGIAAIVWFGDALLGSVLGLAMIANLFFAGLSGIVVPMALNRFGIDPAVASTVFVTTITDVVGFFAFLGLAGLVLL